MRTITIIILSLGATATLHQHLFGDITVDFEELTQFTGDSTASGEVDGQFYNGNDGSGTNNNGWSSGQVFFNNRYTDTGSFDFWSGWSYSNVVNQTSPGFANQYASWAGGGSNGNAGTNPGGIYAVAFGGGAFFNVPVGMRLSLVELSNTTYTALSMLHGDAFAKKFGGATGDDPDFFRIILTGFDHSNGFAGTGNTIGSITIDLADYTFADNSQDFIVEGWQSVDLSSLSDARSLAIEFESSDTGPFGINTPTYIALDNLVLTAIPEPNTLALVALCTFGWLVPRFRKRSLIKS